MLPLFRTPGELRQVVLAAAGEEEVAVLVEHAKTIGFDVVMVGNLILDMHAHNEKNAVSGLPRNEATTLTDEGVERIQLLVKLAGGEPMDVVGTVEAWKQECKDQSATVGQWGPEFVQRISELASRNTPITDAEATEYLLEPSKKAIDELRSKRLT